MATEESVLEGALEHEAKRNPFLQALGERVRTLRSRKGMTRRAVAVAAGGSIALRRKFSASQFIPDVRYRQAIVVFGTSTARANAEEAIKLCGEWLNDYGKIQSDEILSQLPEVHTLIGDAPVALVTTAWHLPRAADFGGRYRQGQRGRGRSTGR